MRSPKTKLEKTTRKKQKNNNQPTKKSLSGQQPNPPEYAYSQQWPSPRPFYSLPHSS